MPAPYDDREMRNRMTTGAPPRHDEELHRRIADRAYGLFLERGGRHGQDLRDWLEAERQVVSELRPRPGAEMRAAPAAPRPAAKPGERSAARPMSVAKPQRRRTFDS